MIEKKPERPERFLQNLVEGWISVTHTDTHTQPRAAGCLCRRVLPPAEQHSSGHKRLQQETPAAPCFYPAATSSGSDGEQTAAGQTVVYTIGEKSCVVEPWRPSLFRAMASSIGQLFRKI